MNGRFVSIVLALLLAVPALAQVPGFEDADLDARYRDLIHEIRCMNCQNQSVAESPAEQAGDIRRLVYDMMAEGRSDDEILAYLRSRYGDFISYQPPFKPSTWLLWAAPGLFLVAGIFVFARILAARMRQPLDEELE
jgi:cytochrome c-type biogenesis protein CcmH